MKPRLLPLLALCGSLALQAAADPAPKQQIVLLKLDDVIAIPAGKSPVSPRWERIADYLKTNHIKGSFGVICESLEKDNPPYFQWIKDIQNGGLIEIWMHGNHMKHAS